MGCWSRERPTVILGCRDGKRPSFALGSGAGRMRRELRLLGRGECVVGFGRRGGRSLPAGLRGWANLAIGLLGAQRRLLAGFLRANKARVTIIY